MSDEFDAISEAKSCIAGGKLVDHFTVNRLLQQILIRDSKIAKLRETLTGVLNSACHPDIAICAVLVKMQPVRDTLDQTK